ncbi:MAG TPA: hypothetical protein VHA52_00860, partial [Candidatus Babeliaceae bacterium]|nr:hypothetical protein [Candidatus Babeliaceae bacterium]
MWYFTFLFLVTYALHLTVKITADCGFELCGKAPKKQFQQQLNPAFTLRHQRWLSGDTIELKIARIVAREAQQAAEELYRQQELTARLDAYEKNQKERVLYDIENSLVLGSSTETFKALSQSFCSQYKPIVETCYGEQEKALNHEALRWKHYQNQASIACYSSSLKQKIEKNPEEAVKLIVSYATEFMLPCACFKAVKSPLKSAKVQQLSSNAVAYYKTLGNQEKTELLLQAP